MKHIVITKRSDINSVQKRSPKLDSNKKEKDNSKKNLSYKKKSIIILGDSIIKEINGWQLAKSTKKCKISSKSLSWCINWLLEPQQNPISRKNPGMIIFHVGTNNLKSEESSKDISDNIVNLALDCRNTVDNVVISELVTRGNNYENKRMGVNSYLNELCPQNNIAINSHENFDKTQLNASKLHPNRKGVGIICCNFINFING